MGSRSGGLRSFWSFCQGTGHRLPPCGSTEVLPLFPPTPVPVSSFLKVTWSVLKDPFTLPKPSDKVKSLEFFFSNRTGKSSQGF